jgi:hypothetical protein
MHAVVIATEHNSGSASGLAQFSFLQENQGDHRTQAGAVVNVMFGAPGNAVAHELGHTMGCLTMTADIPSTTHRCSRG